MKELVNQKTNLHHAYLIEGDKEIIFNKILNFLEKELNFQTQTNPDFWQGDFDTFGIGDGRIINELQNKKAFSWASPKSLGSGKQIFIIKTNFVTSEAQNSLLKMFEEPTKNTHFFIVMNSSETLLPTLKSRLVIIKHASLTPNGGFGEEFLKMNIRERMEFIKQFFPDPKKDKKADKSGAIQLLNNLEEALRGNLEINKINKKETFLFKEILKYRNYLNDRSPSVKMILEHISIITPEK